MGACCSLILYLILISYAGYKASVLEGRKSVDIVQAVLENHYDSDSIFSEKEGLNIAFAVFNPFDPQSLDPSYGRIRFQSFEFG